MTAQEKNAMTFLMFMEDAHHYDNQGTEYWLEPAEEVASDIIRQTHNIKGKKVMRSKRKGDPRVYNHWRALI